MSVEISKYCCIGVNHWKADVTIREKFNLASRELQIKLLEAAKKQGIQNIFSYSTCNRTEIFAYDARPEHLVRLLVEITQGSKSEFRAYGFEKMGHDAIAHLFRVGMGLDSQILGDLQIIKQIKDSVAFSHNHQMITGVMDKLIQQLYITHKRSRTETALAQGAATTAYAAVQFARKTLGELTNKNILLVGTGKIGKVTCKNLLNYGAQRVTLVNRTKTRADELADRFDVNVADYENLADEIAFADLVIVATGATTPIIRKEHMDLATAAGKLTVLLDMSVPRNIEPEIGEMEYVELANMDMLSEVTDEAYKKRASCIPDVEKIIDDQIAEYEIWIAEQGVVPTIKALTEKLDGIRMSEMERVRNKIDQDEFELLALVTKRIVSKIAAHSIEHLKDNTHDKDVHTVVQDMFKLHN